MGAGCCLPMERNHIITRDTIDFFHPQVRTRFKFMTNLSNLKYKPLSQKKIFDTWWPLALSWLLMGLELPAISAVIARLENPEIHLARR